MLGVGSHSDPPRLPYDHAHHRLRAPSQCVLSRIAAERAAERAALLYSKTQHKTCCIVQYSADTVSRARCIAMQQCSAIQRNTSYSNTSQYRIQHRGVLRGDDMGPDTLYDIYSPFPGVSWLFSVSIVSVLAAVPIGLAGTLAAHLH